ncbi:MAG: hypothetical protein JOZ08_09975 [Verrucomicrobia bacterium]|nr:hypothetical protein [Verrucomicrobiota bacterium]MBV8279717.1 hypothetical protein [Verrucomicrobiota bacterium]
MNALCMFRDRDQFRALLHFSDDASAEAFGRMADDLPAESDDRLRALADGELSFNERNYLLEELVDNPELLKRLAELLHDKVSREDE